MRNKNKAPRGRYSIRFFLKQAFTSLWRNGVMSVASVAVLMSCLVVLGAFVLLVANLNKNLDNIAKLNVIMVFCDYDLEEGRADEIESDIKKLSNVDKCVYTNDKYGHEAGNKLIITAARIISTVFKRSPVFRVGGDEFVVVLQNLKKSFSSV